ncbi:uncharacterized protein LOC126911334 isoform X2 [Spodoptera frugiperda]|uniref:Uncharacterized protein LOC126911334 isoform X2 n=1 Tax=Spodoptera frugiperda TaxID=7108 RepID=A0A9R0DVI2_SPOFR|nr:uncharacterized protein LOC126911334 isoform X2 [Spodoptera frugiperda]
MAVTIVTVAEHHYEYRGVHRTSQEEFVLELRQVYRGVHRTSQEEFVLELRQVYRGVHRTSQEEFVLELRQVYRGVHRTSQEEFVLELRQVYREVHQYFSKTGGTRSLHRRGPGIQGVCCADVSDDHALRGLPMLLEGDATVLRLRSMLTPRLRFGSCWAGAEPRWTSTVSSCTTRTQTRLVTAKNSTSHHCQTPKPAYKISREMFS